MTVYFFSSCLHKPKCCNVWEYAYICMSKVQVSVDMPVIVCISTWSECMSMYICVDMDICICVYMYCVDLCHWIWVILTMPFSLFQDATINYKLQRIFFSSIFCLVCPYFLPFFSFSVTLDVLGWTLLLLCDNNNKQ